MAEYAKRIRKLQAEMGIKPTNFDSNILDENTALLIDQSYRKSPTQLDEIQDGEQPTIESEEMDYEQIMAAPTTNSGNRPSPRQEIFATYFSRDNSCPSPAYQPNENVQEKLQIMKIQVTLAHQTRRTRVKSTLKRLNQFIKNNTKHRVRTRIILQFPLPRIPLQFQIQTNLQSNRYFERGIVSILLPKTHPIRYIKTNLVSMTLRKVKWNGAKKKRTFKESQSLVITRASSDQVASKVEFA